MITVFLRTCSCPATGRALDMDRVRLEVPYERLALVNHQAKG